MYDLGHEIDLLYSKARIGSQEEGLVHDPVSSGEFTGNPHGRRVVATELHEGGLAHEIAAEEHAVADFVFIEVADEISAGERRGFLHRDFETEPGTIGAAAG